MQPNSQIEPYLNEKSTVSFLQIEAFSVLCPSSVVLHHGEAVSRQQIIIVNMITIIIMVIASANVASSSLKPCLFSDPSSQESFWSNGLFNLPPSLRLSVPFLLFV